MTADVGVERPRSRWPEMLAVVATLVALAVVVVALVTSIRGSGTGDGPVEGTDAFAGGPAGSMDHPHEPARPMTAEERTALVPELAAAAGGVPWRTVADAMAAGYEITTVDPRHPDDHLVRKDRVDDRFDLTAPEMLLAESNDLAAPIVAEVFWVQGPTAPEGFVGPSDVWHHHPGTCRVGDVFATDGDAGDPDVCRAGGGQVVSEGGWMVHAWVVPGYDNPDGPFAVNNPDVVIGATS